MKEKIGAYLAGIVKNLGFDGAVITVDMPENSVHGDYTTNVAMTLAGHLKAPPRTIAEKISDVIKEDQKKSQVPWLDHVEIAGPGFINLFLSEASFSTVVKTVLKEKERYGVPYYTVITSKNTVNTSGNNPASGAAGEPVENSGSSLENSTTNGGEKPTEATPDAVKKSADMPSASFGKNDVVIPDLIGDRFSPSSKTNTDSRLRENDKTKKKIMVEFAHPNTHKAFHIGHLRNIATGESVVRLLESQGNIVIRANYQGDVGMHIAKALYALINVSPFKDEVQSVTGIKNRVEFLGRAYAAGSQAFETSDDVKKTVGDINKNIYAKDPSVYPLYRETRQWSLDYFESIYRRVYSHFDRYYFESETYQTGKKYVEEGLSRGIFEKSDGAVIFPGEKFGLHNRVFISSEGNATYEGKDMGLGRLQFDEYHPDRIIHCVGPEQAAYFRVMFKALEQLFPDTKGKEEHLVYGWVKLKEGKMSSRLGNVILGEWLIDEVKKEITEVLLQNNSKGKEIDKSDADLSAETIAIGAIKYAFLKVSTPSEIAFDLKESININGDSGPYLQYAYARCKSVLRKAQETGDRKLETGKSENESPVSVYQSPSNPEERALARYMLQFPDIVEDAAERSAPNTVCTYLFQLAQAFNLLYAKHEILGNSDRLELTAATAQVLKNGLYLLGINTLEKM